MFRQNQMPPATTKWQALFGGFSLAQPQPTPTLPVTVPVPSENGNNGVFVALQVGGALLGTAIGVAISYAVCCQAMKRC